MFPTDALEVSGPAYILLPTEPLTCLAVSALLVDRMSTSNHRRATAHRSPLTAFLVLTFQWDATRQKVYAAPVEPPQVAEGANDLSPNELLQATEPTDVHHVWVVSRLAGRSVSGRAGAQQLQ
jgi:protein FRG1